MMKYIASSKSQMTDIEKQYVYSGHEANMITGAWYYWNGVDWAVGGEYMGGVDDIIETSSDLVEDNMPANVGAVKAGIAELKNYIDSLVDEHGTTISFSDPNDDGNIVITKMIEV